MAQSTKEQFDSTLGGDVVLPQTLNVMEFISSRSQEIAALSEAIDNPQRTSVISQRLPKHMQRRIMSHNAKRLPRALRQALIQIREKSGNPNEVSRPRRKYRRRPHNLLSEYNRRQRSFVWLETHIWHAKRFHMINKWGYRLPNYPNDKSYRACYRASTQHCLLQDVSYYVCIELTGDQDNIVNGINKLTSPHCGLTFGAKYYLNGSREGSTVIYHQGKYPYGVIGVVNFLWKPRSNENKNNEISSINKRTIWIWVHPAYYHEFLNEIIDIFNLVKTIDDDGEKMEIDDVKNNGIDGDNMGKGGAEKIWRFKNRITKYFSKLHPDLSVIELKDTINRFRLTGPLSQPVLTSAFVLLDPDSNVALSQSELQKNNLSDDDWIGQYYSVKENIDLLKAKCELWLKLKNITDPRQLPSGLVLPLVIQDPRFNLPDKRTKAISDTKAIEDQFIVDPPSLELLNDSPFWDYIIRNKVTDNKLSTSDLSQLQSKQLVPSSIKDIAKEFNVRHYLPVILIRNNSYSSTIDYKQKGICNGWDIILPSGWAMPVWLSLVWRGARVGGLRESGSLRRESGIMPPIFPDSNCCQIEDEIEKQTLAETYFKKPPAKRPNFKKLGIVAPFSYPWKELLKDWNNLESLPSSFFVIRDKIQLNRINLLLNKLNRSKSDCKSDRYDLKNLEMNDGDSKNALIAMNVKIHGRGTINEHSVVCLPLKEDLDLIINNKSKMINARPTEISHDDPERADRVSLRKNHLKYLKRMKKKRKKFKSDNDIDNYKLLKVLTKESIKNKDCKMKELWLTDLDNVNIKDSSSRKIIGYVVAGDYSFTSSCSSGQTYIVLTALFELFRSQADFPNNKFFVLIRNSSSPQYSFACISLANSSSL